MEINICLIGEQKIIREGIKSLLDHPPIRVIAEGSSSEIDKLLLPSTDVLLIECSDNLTGFLARVDDIHKRLPKLKIIAITTGEDDLEMLQQLLEAGVSGYLTQNASFEELSHSIRKVLDEGIYVCTTFVMRMLKNPEYQIKKKKPDIGLKKAELDVLHLIAEGLTNYEISLKLFISVRTVENRRKKLLEKTRTTNTATLIKFAVQNGFIV